MPQLPLDFATTRWHFLSRIIIIIRLLTRGQPDGLTQCWARIRPTVRIPGLEPIYPHPMARILCHGRSCNGVVGIEHQAPFVATVLHPAEIPANQHGSADLGCSVVPHRNRMSTIPRTLRSLDCGLPKAPWFRVQRGFGMLGTAKPESRSVPMVGLDCRAGHARPKRGFIKTTKAETRVGMCVGLEQQVPSQPFSPLRETP